MKIALFITATGKYNEFLPNLIRSADQFFMPGEEVVYIVFTDDINNKTVHTTRGIEFMKIEHKPFPEGSMYRSWYYAKYLQNWWPLEGYTHCFAIDADAYFFSEITTEICWHELVAVAHSAYVDRTIDAPFERNEDSNCCVKRSKHYVGGGFYGGKTHLFKMMCNLMFLYIENDKLKGITPIWHDESALNKFVAVNSEMVHVLPPTYHYCEYEPGQLNPYMQQLWDEKAKFIENEWNIKPPFRPKIIFIDKNKNGKGQDYYRGNNEKITVEIKNQIPECKKKASRVYRFPNGMVATFDQDGNQIPELQGRYSEELMRKIKANSNDATCLYGFPLLP